MAGSPLQEIEFLKIENAALYRCVLDKLFEIELKVDKVLTWLPLKNSPNTYEVLKP